MTNLDEIQQRAATLHDTFEVMRYMLEQDDDLTDIELDAAVTQIAAPIIAAIDCLQCANCCNNLDVYLTPDDAQRLCAHLKLQPAEFSQRYVEHEAAQQEGEWGMFRYSPCVFLEGKWCSHYEHRPESCRIYPVFTPDFRWTLTDLIEGSALCPIILHTLEAVNAWYEERLAAIREANAK